MMEKLDKIATIGICTICIIFIIEYLALYFICLYNGIADLELVISTIRHIILNVFIISLNIYINKYYE